ncbi:Ni/Fe hydrogenase subunit alpha [Haliangium sp.]|uniref:Ni/Fe hydrogenase subunit alpha n=1 Tax=Haliangium sp. TaxID=2663208 RepID=UPI003D12C80C
MSDRQAPPDPGSDQPEGGRAGVREYKVDLLTRVEGEGRFYLRVEDGRVTNAELAIFEAPRYFEAFLRGRSLYEVSDIVARICGICPIAYQMSSARALENALGITLDPQVRRLRRLIYCGEWIESHALHIYLLHAPDFLGYPSSIEMAAHHRDLVERGLRMKKLGNALVELLGGRAVHPVSPRVGGFTKAPSRRALTALREQLEACLGEAEETVAWTSTLPMPGFEQNYVAVALVGDEYPLEWGDRFAVSGRGTFAVDEFEEVCHETQAPHSHALQCRLRDGTPYICGPLARLNHCHDTLHPRARDALARSGVALPVTNPYQSIVVRAIELVHAFAEAIDIIDAYQPPSAPYVEFPVRAGEGAGATEAPRGMLFHRYRVDAEGLIEHARIVPPTSQNQARIEADLVGIARELLALPHDQATHRCEQLIRAYDPCISCATHFLRLDIDRAEPAEPPANPDDPCA